MISGHAKRMNTLEQLQARQQRSEAEEQGAVEQAVQYLAGKLLTPNQQAGEGEEEVNKRNQEAAQYLAEMHSMQLICVQLMSKKEGTGSGQAEPSGSAFG